EEQMSERIDQGGWTVKDHLAHLVTWEQGIIALLKHEPRYPAMGTDLETVRDKNEDALNDFLRAPYETATLADVRDRLRKTHDELAAVVASLEPDALLRTYSHYQPDEPGTDSGEPVLRWVVGNSGGHYLEHLPWIQQLSAQAGD
ncbi:MAG: ClbS/DfsB family four-helix bundle protein, partial [Gammaproteobacteria bacterium]